MRFFLIAYVADTPTKQIEGNIYFEHTHFPNVNWIKEKVKERVSDSINIVVTNIFEFKSEKDFNNFSG